MQNKNDAVIIQTCAVTNRFMQTTNPKRLCVLLCLPLILLPLLLVPPSVFLLHHRVQLALIVE